MLNRQLLESRDVSLGHVNVRVTQIGSLDIFLPIFGIKSVRRGGRF